MKSIVEETRKYWEKEYNCSRAAARGILDYYGFKSQSEVLDSAMLAFGGGMGVRSICGFVTGTLAALGIIVSEKGMDNEKQYDVFSEFRKKFYERMGTLNCGDILKDFISPDGTLDKDHPDRRKQCDKALDDAVLVAKEIIDRL